jgi:hypothetical protein
MSNCSIVIARYNEDLSWSSSLNKNLKIYLYNKGNEIVSDSLNLPNIGRESDTFLHHIIENYDRIDDFTIFLQGNPLSHYNRIIEFINDEQYKKKDIFFLSDWIATDDINGDPNHIGLEISNVLDDMCIKFDQDIKFNFPSGAQYCVHNKFIYNKSLDWWKKLYQVHNKYINDSPWIFERIWPLIWSIEEKSSF